MSGRVDRVLVEQAARAIFAVAQDADPRDPNFASVDATERYTDQAEAVLAVVVPLVERSVRERIAKQLDQTPYRMRDDWVKIEGGTYTRRDQVPTFDCADVRRVIADA